MEHQGEAKPRRLGRRGLIVGGLGAAAASLLGRTDRASAALDEPPIGIVLGGRNTAAGPTALEFSKKGAISLEAANPAGGIGVLGSSGVQQAPAANGIEAGLWGYGRNGGVGAWGQSEGSHGVVGISDSEIGVLGVAGAYGDAPTGNGIRAGLWGYAKQYVGAWGQSWTSTGVLGMSASQVGVIGTSGTPYSADQLARLDAAGIHAAASGATPAFCAASDGGPAAIGMSAKHIGVIGVSGSAYSEDDLAKLDPAGMHAAATGVTPAFCAASDAGPAAIGMSAKHIGVVGTTGNAYSEDQIAQLDPAGIHAASTGTLDALCAEAVNGTGVEGMATGKSGIGVAAVNAAGGTALRVEGRIQSNMIDAGSVARKRDLATVQCNSVSANSHVQVTFNGEPPEGGFWVERQPGRGFVVHLSDKTKRDLPFTYWVADPA
jgi:hypothetical protein